MLYILDKKQKTVGVANNSTPKSLPYFDDNHKESVKGVSTFEFKVPADHEDSKLIVGNNHIIKRDLDGNNLLFTIKNVQESYSDGKKFKNVFCENTAIDELITDVYRPLTLESVTLKEAVSIVLASTEGWTIGNINKTDPELFKVKDYITVLEALNTLTELFFCEMYFTVKLDGTQVVEKQVNFVKQRGTETNVRFEYGYNLTGVSRTEDTSNVVTALVGAGKGDTSGSRITLQSLNSFDDGEFYKPVNTDWIGSKSALQRWSKDGKHIFGIFVDDESEDQARLKIRTIRELEERSQPYLQYSCSVVTLERLTGYDAQRLRIGDRVLIKDTTFEPAIAFTGRVIELQRSETDPTQDKVDLGSFKPVTLSDSKAITNLQKTLSRNEEVWNASSYELTVESTGGTVFKNGTGWTTLRARVYHKEEEVDLDGTILKYVWSEYDEHGNFVKSTTGKELEVRSENIANKATFRCEVE